MHKLMEIIVCVLAIIGLACVVKHIIHCEGSCCLCGWHKTKEEDEKNAGAASSFKIRVD